MQNGIQDEYQLFGIYSTTRERDSPFDCCRFSSNERTIGLLIKSKILMIIRSYVAACKFTKSIKLFFKNCGIQRHRGWKFHEQISVQNRQSTAFMTFMASVKTGITFSLHLFCLTKQNSCIFCYDFAKYSTFSFFIQLVLLVEIFNWICKCSISVYL